MTTNSDPQVPNNKTLISATFAALKILGGSGTNQEIHKQVISDLAIPDDVADLPHLGNVNQTELEYRLAWARTYLKIYGAIENSARSVWSIRPEFVNIDEIDEDEVVAEVLSRNSRTRGQNDINSVRETGIKFSTENQESEHFKSLVEPQSWRGRMEEILQNMNTYSFERLAQRVLRECGFSQVEVTRKLGDGGIDGTGKIKINGIISFNIAFQIKRHVGLVGTPEIRDFRDSLTTDIEKGVLITTGTFSRAAKDEASKSGKKQIDLIDGEEFINMIAEYSIGVKEIKTYEIDEDFFRNI